MAQSKAKTVTSLLILLTVLAFRCQAGYDDLLLCLLVSYPLSKSCRAMALPSRKTVIIQLKPEAL